MPPSGRSACSCSSERRTVPCWPDRTSSVQTAVWRMLFVSARLFRQNLLFARKHGSGRRFPHRTRQKRRRAYIAIPRGRAPEIQAQDGAAAGLPYRSTARRPPFSRTGGTGTPASCRFFRDPIIGAWEKAAEACGHFRQVSSLLSVDVSLSGPVHPLSH